MSHSDRPRTSAATAAATAARMRQAAERAAADPEARGRALRVVRAALRGGQLDFLDVLPPGGVETRSLPDAPVLEHEVRAVREAVARGELTFRDIVAPAQGAIEHFSGRVGMSDAG